MLRIVHKITWIRCLVKMSTLNECEFEIFYEIIMIDSTYVEEKKKIVQQLGLNLGF